MWHKIKKISTCLWISGMFLTFLLAFCLLNLNLYKIESDSMVPTIHTGDVAILLPGIQPESLKEGDIAAYNSGSGITVLHRTVRPLLDEESDRVSWVMKGDANAGEDVEHLTYENCAGKCILVVTSANRAAFRFGFGFAIIFPLILVSVGGYFKAYASYKVSGKDTDLADKGKR